LFPVKNKEFANDMAISLDKAVDNWKKIPGNERFKSSDLFGKKNFFAPLICLSYDKDTGWVVKRINWVAHLIWKIAQALGLGLWKNARFEEVALQFKAQKIDSKNPVAIRVASVFCKRYPNKEPLYPDAIRLTLSPNWVGGPQFFEKIKDAKTLMLECPEGVTPPKECLKGIETLQKLECLTLRGFKSIEKLPDAIGQLNELEEFAFESGALKGFPRVIFRLDGLIKLSLYGAGGSSEDSYLDFDLEVVEKLINAVGWPRLDRRGVNLSHTNYRVDGKKVSATSEALKPFVNQLTKELGFNPFDSQHPSAWRPE